MAVWWSLVRFRRAISFLFFGQNGCFLGQIAVWLGILVHPKKRPMGIFPWVRKTYPNAKNRAPGVENYPFCDCRLGTRGRFFGRTGRFEPPDVTSTSGNVALWTSRALKYLKYHRTGRSNERFGGCGAAKKSPFLPKRAEQAKKAKKRPKSVSSQLCTTVAYQ